MAKVTGKLTKIDGIPTLVVKTEPVPGPSGIPGMQGERGQDGLNGQDGPSLEEVVETLKTDNEFLSSIVNSKKWTFEVIRDEMGFIKEIIAESEMV